jgi:hypothetical protein
MALAVGNPTYVTDLPKGLVAWHSRDSAGAITGIGSTETGFIRIDGIPIRNGYHYLIECPQVNVTSSTEATAAAPIIGVVNLRFSLTGSATTASARLPYGAFLRNSQPVSHTSTTVFGINGMYNASADGTMSVLMSVIRDAASTTGSVGLFASTGNPCPMFVYEMGPYPGVSGVDI